MFSLKYHYFGMYQGQPQFWIKIHLLQERWYQCLAEYLDQWLYQYSNDYISVDFIDFSKLIGFHYFHYKKVNWLLGRFIIIFDFNKEDNSESPKPISSSKDWINKNLMSVVNW